MLLGPQLKWRLISIHTHCDIHIFELCGKQNCGSLADGIMVIGLVLVKTMFLKDHVFRAVGLVSFDQEAEDDKMLN